MSSYVVTGAARGIGFEFIAQLSAESQNTVFALVRNKATTTKLNALPRNNITVLEADITDAKALELAAGEVSQATGGKLDYLINNAAISNHPGFTLDKFPSAEAVEKDLLNNFKVNTIGVVHTTNAFLPLLRKGKAKKVVTLSTGLADLKLTLAAEAAGQAPYSISKAALNMVVAKYAAQLKGEGFTFLAISPGLVNTSVSAPTTNELEEIKMLSKSLAKVAPDFKGPITPEESVKMCLKVINRWGVEETGTFVSHHGNKQWL
ncbi:hypothetical protein DFH07DRAFT_739288 [Mycena maculata]|uniref:Ketoreductase domain-containing protein n=1 Tax=Mycena maculata TaxID=230809 RepID=A0AAD7NIW3_9AGAR|nr:hypothetical protein DFH07DRAFT_739288 [Mycena maculata]